MDLEHYKKIYRKMTLEKIQKEHDINKEIATIIINGTQKTSYLLGAGAIILGILFKTCSDDEPYRRSLEIKNERIYSEIHNKHIEKESMQRYSQITADKLKSINAKIYAIENNIDSLESCLE